MKNILKNNFFYAPKHTLKTLLISKKKKKTAILFFIPIKQAKL
jgi:hypothetical protein